MLRCLLKSLLTTGLCVGCGIRVPPGTAARFYNKDKYLEPMFGDVGQGRTKAGIFSGCYFTLMRKLNLINVGP